MKLTHSIAASCAPCSVLLLAGGRGARIGGQDKGLLPWKGKPLIEHVQAIVRPFTDDLIISCNRNDITYRTYADQTVKDSQKNFPGPLAGVLAGLAAAHHGWLLVLACDAPKIDAPLIKALLEARSAFASPLMVQQGEKWQPMFSMIPKVLLAGLQQDWNDGERSLLRALLRHHPKALICAEDDPRLSNFNTPELLS
ncbi:molybdenum cofactor guanylyltransferase MobA [Pseudomonas sp. Bout1]|uniref:molybdenum cofactor guanylyltransferase MobA n=1 Tax=Pseudomonas sp. Bout1 TaxID=3048600 RepID=UPI002AB44B33|nr:molybdenum cofactor guanylyltransferase MobA [Pseudomonas sp. Bout1]MDY7533279.1 molybdenum cofactor guanylyltransferase MobA [Pseudomonas sp. Bout1]MEB0183844.1 molybdenum cofactor guanylyltransferase MobA [Pseudomonas sp. Bout1]